MKNNNVQDLKKQQGQSMVEYLVVTSALIAALIIGGNDSVMNKMGDALKGSYEGYSYTISVAELPDEDK